MSTYLVLDGCCKAGGMSVGFDRAFKGSAIIIGVDIEPQKNYPYDFVQMDILEFLDKYGQDFDYIHVSPECKRYTRLMAVKGSAQKSICRAKYPDMLPLVRKKLTALGKPYTIENTTKKYMLKPITLCGEMFGLRVIRHRFFETNLAIPQPKHIKHKGTVQDGYYAAVYGTGGALMRNDGTGRRLGSTHVSDWRKAMGIDWMLRSELSQAIPPAYAEYIGMYVYHYLQEIG